MGKPAARIGDMHTCPMYSGDTPHVGGPITGPGVSTVLIGGAPAVVTGDMATCSGPPDSIAIGSTGVFIGGKPAARMGDSTAHGGVIVGGCATVLVGQVASTIVDPLKRSFLEIELVDHDSIPLAGERYEIELPSGQKLYGVTNPKGVVRIEGIDPGQCKVRFPDYE